MGDLLRRYNRAADDLDLDTFAALFLPDGEFEFVNEEILLQSRPVIREFVSRSTQRGTHTSVDIVVTQQDESTATSTSRLIEMDRKLGVVFRSGTYQDTLRWHDGAWRFARRSLTFHMGEMERKPAPDPQ